MSPIFLKDIKQLFDWHVRDVCLILYSLRTNQHAYLKKRSVEFILHNVVIKIEDSIKDNESEYTLATLVIIEGAFDKTSIESIITSCVGHGVPLTIIRFITIMLEHRIVVAKLDNACSL